jgi:hypothetical protein
VSRRAERDVERVMTTFREKEKTVKTSSDGSQVTMNGRSFAHGQSSGTASQTWIMALGTESASEIEPCELNSVSFMKCSFRKMARELKSLFGP